MCRDWLGIAVNSLIEKNLYFASSYFRGSLTFSVAYGFGQLDFFKIVSWLHSNLCPSETWPFRHHPVGEHKLGLGIQTADAGKSLTKTLQMHTFRFLPRSATMAMLTVAVCFTSSVTTMARRKGC